MTKKLTVKNEMVKGFVGVTSTGLGAAISLSNVEQWLRIASLVLGCLVGLASLVSILKGLLKRKIDPGPDL